VLVTAGPTHEPIDPVRYLGNRSSGKMGFALASEAARRGAIVTLVAGPTTAEPPGGTVEVVNVRSAAEMYRAVIERASDVDVVIMAAAVADYTPAEVATEKIAKDDETLTIQLRRTVDILARLGRQRGSGERPLLVGFAAETHDVLAKARSKRQAKRVDLIVANDVSRTDAGFESESNSVTLIAADGEQAVPLQPKAGVARAILDRVESMLSVTVRTLGGPFKARHADPEGSALQIHEYPRPAGPTSRVLQ
jgi:phosphopantothenoylcysteine decarboxylase/phosphopantothenate--cysteine ligase